MAVTNQEKATRKTSTSRKPATSEAPANKKALAEGDRVFCEICGMGVVVEEVADIAAYHELVCCGTAMKPKKSRTAKKTGSAK